MNEQPPAPPYAAPTRPAKSRSRRWLELPPVPFLLRHTETPPRSDTDDAAPPSKPSNGVRKSLYPSNPWL